jgi:hypothetical protein
VQYSSMKRRLRAAISDYKLIKNNSSGSNEQ